MDASKRSQLIFPALLILMNVGASLVAFKAGDWRRGVYWITSALLLVTVAGL
ncbi:MAG TPA: hypothetical protein VFW03_26675 [Gemmatimonadaceae bacterium]|nr:hypothetical protein [Gemmatimonadaceae bacterium]